MNTVLERFYYYQGDYQIAANYTMLANPIFSNLSLEKKGALANFFTQFTPAHWSLVFGLSPVGGWGFQGALIGGQTFVHDILRNVQGFEMFLEHGRRFDPTGIWPLRYSFPPREIVEDIMGDPYQEILASKISEVLEGSGNIS
ncbi:hypothetical protein Gasu2_33630 [Galdieria sulphuraria]|nr:hypothetical protein Gasu2_33630 [Galdieria sulphuraria]